MNPKKRALSNGVLPHLAYEQRSKKATEIAESDTYVIRKYGLYRYQAFMLDRDTGDEKKIGSENTFGIVASDLVDRMFKDLTERQP